MHSNTFSIHDQWVVYLLNIYIYIYDIIKNTNLLAIYQLYIYKMHYLFLNQILACKNVQPLVDSNITTLQVTTEIIWIQELKLTSSISIVHIQKCIIYLSVNFKLNFSIQPLVNRKITTLHVPPEKWRELHISCKTYVQS